MTDVRTRRFAALVVLGGLVSLLPSPALAFDDVLRLPGVLRTPDQPQPRRIDVYRIDGVDYLDLNEVARLFRATKYWRVELEKMVLRVGGHRVRLTVGSPFVFVDGEESNLLAPVLWQEGRIVVPTRLVTGVLDPLVPESVTWSRSRRVLRVDTGEPNILGVEYDVRRNGTVVKISLADPLTGELEFPRPDRVVLRVPGGVLAPRMAGGFSGVGLLDSLVTVQEPGYARLIFHLGPLGGTAELLTRMSPPRLLLAVSEGLPDDIPLPEFERRAGGGEEGLAQVRTLVLDPGHGGSDPGIVTPSGVAEKEICLEIALRTKELLEGIPGLEVHLTREDDRFLSGVARAEIANGLKGDILISIHCNGWFDPGMRGFSLGVPRGEETIADAELPRWGERTTRIRQNTEALAEILQEEMAALSLPSRGVRTAGYGVLEGTMAPAVLLECGFLTNPRDAAVLADPGFHDAVAVVLAEGIEEYRRFLTLGGVRTP